MKTPPTSDESHSQIIIKKSALMRTPPPTLNETSQTPLRKVNQSGMKRVAEEELNRFSEDMYHSLMNRFNTLSNEIRSMEEKYEEKLDDKFNSLQGFMERTDKKLESIEERVQQNSTRSDENSKAINLLNQKELQNKMEIVGVKWPETTNKDQMKEEVVKKLSECKIKVEISSIKSAYIKKTKLASGHVMVIEFADFDTKLRVLKEKRQQKMKDGIFFDSSLTPTNGKLMGTARKIAREKNFKIYMNNNRIHVRKSNSEVKWIESEEDLEAVKLWLPNEDKRTQKTYNDPSSAEFVQAKNSSQ